MGKKGSWFSAIKRVFTHNSNEKPINGSDKKNRKEKKKGKGILSHSDTKSFIPLFREPSSIEKILGEADQLLIKPLTPELPKTPPSLLERPTSPSAASPKAASPQISPPKLHLPAAISPKAARLKAAPQRFSTPGSTSSKAAAPKVAQSRKEISYVKRPEPTLRNQNLSATKIQAVYRGPEPTSRNQNLSATKIQAVYRGPEPTLRNQNLSATKIQAVYRGYVGRRSFRALRGLVRLQGVVRGQNVKRQTSNAMKQMQLLVRVQTQIQSRRIQMLESRAQAYRNDKEVESTLSKWTQLSDTANNEDWDDSSLTKEEVEERLRKKVEAVVKRERAMAYAYSNQLWKSNPRSAQSTLDIRSNGYPWWWNWLERQLPPTTASQTQTPAKNVPITPPRPISVSKPSPRLHSTNYKQNFTFNNQESLTPRSSKSSIPTRPKPFQTPSRTPPPTIKYSKARASESNSAYDVSLKDDDSLMSCPPFSVPNYMTPTVSAKVKARANSNPKERFMGTPSNDSKRRFSFPLTPNIGPFKWKNGGSKDYASQKGLEKHRSTNSIGDVSIDSAVSMPAIGGRKPFNRFV